jgi:DNA-binding transcriptional LysR family regulator
LADPGCVAGCGDETYLSNHQFTDKHTGIAMNTAQTAQLANRIHRLKPAHLRLIAELLHEAQLGLAAARMAITQPAASRLLAEIEDLVGLPVRSRSGRGLALTPVGLSLARRASRIQTELNDAAREMAEAAQGGAGLVRVGAVTGPALRLVMPALAQLQADHPDFQAEVVVATSEVLTEQLLSGRLDFALGRVSDADALIDLQPIGPEMLALVVRRGHPLLKLARLEPDHLFDFDWVMPDEQTLLTRAVRARLIALGLPQPNRRISTASFLFTLALLTQTDAIAPLSAAVAESFSGSPSLPFVTLPITLGLEVEPFGLMTRRNGQLTPTAALLAQVIGQLARVGT